MDREAPALFPEDPEEMRRSGYKVVDAIVRRWSSLDETSAWCGATHDVTAAALDGPPPEEGRELEELLDVALEQVLPLAGRIDHPRFLAFVPSSPTWTSLLGSFLSAGYNIFQGTWLESSGPSQIEVTVTEWIRQWMGYPHSGGGLFTSGGSAANLIALVAAREAAGNPARGAVYVSDQAHSSVARAARIAGLGPDQIRRVPTDAAFRMEPPALVSLVREDRTAGLDPFCVVGTAGATNTGAIDPLAALARVARDERLWFHVDGAYGGFAVLDPATRPELAGIELSDSITLDPHKWLFQPYETGCLMARDVHRLEEAFRIMPEYLQDTVWGPGNVNFCDRGIQLTRSFRALRVWLSIQHYGLGSHRREIARGIALAKAAEARIREEPELELLAPSSLSVVCFRFNQAPEEPAAAGGSNAAPSGAERPEDAALDALNESIQQRIVDSGHAMMSSTRLGGRFSLRFCIVNTRTEWQDVSSTIDAVLEHGRALAGE